MPASDYVLWLREKIGNATIMLPSATAIIFNDAGEILLHQRSDNGKWSLIGGAADPGEHPAETIIRETYEEVGVTIAAEKVVGIYTLSATYSNGDQVTYTSIAFKCRIVAGIPHVADDESLAVRFFAPDKLPETLNPNHRLRIRHALTRTEPYFEVPELVPAPNDDSYMRKIRAHIGAKRMMLLGTNAIVRDATGRILVQKRTDIDIWGLPGGIMEIGEAAAATVMREVYEETGLEVQPVRLVGVYGGEENFVTYPNGDQVAYVDYVFDCRITGGELITANAESAALKFVAPENLPQPFYPFHIKLIDHTLNLTDTYFVMP